MKTIEERAKEYADRLKSAEIGDFGVATVYGYKDVYNANMAAYKRGSTEQKAIDDAKWLKIKTSWEKEAQITHDDELNYKQGYHDAIEKACEACKNELRRLEILLNESVGVPANLMSVGKSLSAIRREMEESL